LLQLLPPFGPLRKVFAIEPGESTSKSEIVIWRRQTEQGFFSDAAIGSSHMCRLFQCDAIILKKYCTFVAENAKEVMDRFKTLDAEDHFIRKVRDTQQEELLKCEQQTNEIYKNLEDLHEHTSKLFQLKADREALISKCMSDITDKLNHRKQKVKALHEATGWYKRLLSLRCEYSDAVKFIFTNVDPRDPDRVFSFSIRLDKSTSSWTMVECKPRMEAAASFVESLNKNNELSRFVRSMRREFEVVAVRSRYLVK
uniref:Kinetochore protein SPC25 n=3 Tax=Physcomitrium patens TaxID=3218 RepID=A0A7I4EIP9_PHYPA